MAKLSSKSMVKKYSKQMPRLLYKVTGLSWFKIGDFEYWTNDAEVRFQFDQALTGKLIYTFYSSANSVWWDSSIVSIWDTWNACKKRNQEKIFKNTIVSLEKRDSSGVVRT